MHEPVSDAALDTLFREGRTYNHYLDRPVSEDQLRGIWDLMKWGPTSANQLPARLVWCVSDAAKAKLAACAQDLLDHRGACVVVAGAHQPAAVHAIAYALNAFLGNIGTTVDFVAAGSSDASSI